MTAVIPCNLTPVRTILVPNGGSTQELDLHSVTDCNGALIFQVLGNGALSVEFTPAADAEPSRSFVVIDGQIQFVKPFDLVDAAKVKWSSTGTNDGLVTIFEVRG